MNNILNISRYVLTDHRKALIIFYSIYISIAVFSSTMIFIIGDRSLNSWGLGISSAIFLFIAALNSFGENYAFMQSFNISRRTFYVSIVIGLIGLALIMSIINVVFTNTFKLIESYQGLFEQIYTKTFFIDDFFWIFSLLICVSSLGFFITLLYYRCNKVMKFVISIVPVLVGMFISIIDNITNVAIWNNIWDFIIRIFGFTNGSNPYTAVITFIICSAICFGLSFLLIRRATIKL